WPCQRTVMPDSWGQHSAARAARRWRSEVLVDSGGRAIWPSCPRCLVAESEYHRFGTLAYLAAYDVHRAQVIGRCEATTGIKPFTALVDQVMSAEPYASASRVSWVVDNGASHRNWAAAAGSATPIRTRRWSTCPSTPPGSTRSRSTSPSSSASSSPRRLRRPR